MCRNLSIAFAVLAATLAAAAPAAAFSFRFERGEVLDDRVLGTLVNSYPTGYFIEGLRMKPHALREPRESIYMLCAWAQGKPYVVGVRPDPHELDCIIRQEAANGMRRNGLELIYPDRWYCVWLTPAELRNVLDVQQHDSGESYRLDQVERDVDTLDDRVDALEERAAANERAIRDEATARHIADEEHRARHDALDRRLGELGESTNPPSAPSAGPVWSVPDAWVRWIEKWWLLVIFILLIVLVLWWFGRSLARSESQKQPAAPTPQPAPPAPQQVQPQEQVVRIIVEASPQPASAPPAGPAPDVQPTSAPQPPSPPPSDGFTVEIVDKQKRKHTIRFAEASPDAKGRERGISPWTGNEILRARAALHAQEYIDKEGKPKPRSN